MSGKPSQAKSIRRAAKPFLRKPRPVFRETRTRAPCWMIGGPAKNMASGRTAEPAGCVCPTRGKQSREPSIGGSRLLSFRGEQAVEFLLDPAELREIERTRGDRHPHLSEVPELVGTEPQ